ncbi:MAG: HEAT repeat domain-containing protein [Planctomycetota bacterium]|jgi:hypothetical protein
MRVSILILLLTIPAQDIPTDEEAKKAIEVLKETLKAAEEEPLRIEAAREALKTPHEKVIKAVAKLLRGESDNVRMGVAGAIAEVDHPASVDVLLKALKSSRDKEYVYRTILGALGKLGWERALKTLHGLLGDVKSPASRKMIPFVVNAIRAICSPQSVPALIHFLGRVEGTKDRQDQEFQAKAIATLRYITSGNCWASGEWSNWWAANRGWILKECVIVYWLKDTHKRVKILASAKAPKGAERVVMRFGEAPDKKEEEEEEKK